MCEIPGRATLVRGVPRELPPFLSRACARPRRWWRLAAVACLLFAPHARAAEVLQLGEVTVRARRPSFADQPQQVQVLDREAITRSGARDLGGLLATSGFAVRTYGAAGALSTLSLRGALGEGVLILKDGIKLNSPERGGADLSTVSLLGVTRVEILDGGASSLYGAEAVGGVIRLITGDRPVSRLEAGLGSFGERYVALELAGREQGLAWQGGFKRRSAANDFAYYDPKRDEVLSRTGSGFDGSELTLGLKQRWGYETLGASLQYDLTDRGVPGPLTSVPTGAAQHDGNLRTALTHEHPWDDALVQRSSLSYQHAELTFHDPVQAAAFDSQSKLDSLDLQTLLDWTPEGHRLQAGVGYTRDGVTSSRLGTQGRELFALFAHEAWYLTDRLTSYGDLRLDRHPTFGWNLSPRLGLSYSVTEGLRLRAAAGQAYRAPTFNDLYWPRGPYEQGNPALRPETTWTAEAGADWQPLAGYELNLTGFAHRGQDSIQWQPGADGRWMPHNLGQTQVMGVEGKLRLQPWSFLGFSGSLTWLTATDLAHPELFLIYRPDLVAHLDGTWRPGAGWSANLGWDLVGRRFTTAANTDLLPAYGLWSARIGWSWSVQDELFLAGQNLLNAYYQAQPDYPMPGLTLMTGWSRTF